MDLRSQSPDGDFFDPEVPTSMRLRVHIKSHSPLTGIFLIRSSQWQADPDLGALSQSPDGDFFDPERRDECEVTVPAMSHSPLTGIFLIRRTVNNGGTALWLIVTVP